MITDRNNILCVDDDPDDLFLIRESIQRLSSISIESAKNGKQALEILHQRKLSNGLPSLIVTDINMPKMDGNKMLRAIKEDDDLKKIPIIVFTTSANNADLQYINNLKIEMIVKPTDWASYESIAKRILSYLSNTVNNQTEL